MQRTSFNLLLAAVVCCLVVPAAAPAKEACTSIQALCAIEAGGKCDTQTGHWCVGHYKGQECGGSGPAFRACLVHHGAESDLPAEAASHLGKCNSVQAQCAIEIGGSCNPSTGFWCYGPFQGRNCGGSPHATQEFDLCVSRKLHAQK
jgi:hypothetical protein